MWFDVIFEADFDKITGRGLDEVENSLSKQARQVSSLVPHRDFLGQPYYNVQPYINSENADGTYKVHINIFVGTPDRLETIKDFMAFLALTGADKCRYSVIENHYDDEDDDDDGEAPPSTTQAAARMYGYYPDNVI